MTRKCATWIGGTALLVGLLLVGCTSKNKTNSDAKTSPEPNGGTSQNVAAVGDGSPGAKIFNAHNCTKCHSIGATPGGMPKKDLSTVGKEHDLTYISDHIRNAKGHKPMSRMPPYGEDKLSAADLKVLSEYLASLK